MRIDFNIFVISVPQPDSLGSEERDGIPLYRVCEDAIVTLDPNFSGRCTGRVPFQQVMLSEIIVKEKTKSLLFGSYIRRQS